MIAKIKSEVRRVVVILENRERRIEKKQSIYGNANPAKNSNWLSEQPSRNSKISFKKLVEHHESANFVITWVYL